MSDLKFRTEARQPVKKHWKAQCEAVITSRPDSKRAKAREGKRCRAISKFRDPVDGSVKCPKHGGV